MSYNKTQLNPETAMERHVFHRDQFAHYLRWTHLLKEMDIGKKVMDFGCGSGNQYEVLYRNRYSPARFLGLDIRKQTIEKNKEKFPKAEWVAEDLVEMKEHYGTDWDYIVSFEVAEHVGKNNVPKFLDNIKSHCNKDTVVMLSTPCFDERVGAAGNHTYDSGDGRGVAPQELTYDELKAMLEERFEIIGQFGTFASIKDYKDHLTPGELEVFEKLKGYYDSNLVSVIFAPLVPQHSRNVLWKCKLKA